MEALAIPCNSVLELASKLSKLYREIDRNFKKREKFKKSSRCSIIRDSVAFIDIDGNMPLHRAVAADKVDIFRVNVLLETYPDAIFHRNNKGWLPLHVRKILIVIIIFRS